MDSIISEIFSAMVVLSHMGSMFMVASLRFSVCTRRSTMTDARWSWVGENISFMFFSLQKISNALDLNAVLDRSGCYVVFLETCSIG